MDIAKELIQKAARELQNFSLDQTRSAELALEVSRRAARRVARRAAGA